MCVGVCHCERLCLMVSVAADVNTKYIEKKTVKLAGTLKKGEKDKKKNGSNLCCFSCGEN